MRLRPKIFSKIELTDPFEIPLTDRQHQISDLLGVTSSAEFNGQDTFRLQVLVSLFEQFMPLVNISFR